MARRKRVILPMTSAPPWRVAAVIERKGDPPGDDLDALLDAALVASMARQDEPEAG